ncbi:hypothetical protein [Sinomonas atrocyanea]|uniref:hypothetical protein n=1 Tax=Sinomonas atrocyanea TaxID=37927 RepID=UPI003D9673C2
MSGTQAQGRTLERLRVWESAAVARQFAAATASGLRAWCIAVYLTPMIAAAAARGQLVRCGRVSAIVGPRPWLARHLPYLAVSALMIVAAFMSGLLGLGPIMESLLPVYFLGVGVWVAFVTAASAFMTPERKQLLKSTSAFARRHGRGRGDAVNLLTYPEETTDDELRAAAEEIIVSTNPTTMVVVCCLTQREAEAFLGLEVGLERDGAGSTILVGPPVPQPDASEHT